MVSLAPISLALDWNFNIVGKYSDSLRQEILKKYPKALIAHDNQSSYYEVVKKQIYVLPKDSKTMLFFLMEDHWFICSHKNLFSYLLEEFYGSKADVLRVAHATEFWDCQDGYQLTVDKLLYKEYVMDTGLLKKLWQKYPGAYLTNLPVILKKSFAIDLLENNKSLLQSKKPGG